MGKTLGAWRRGAGPHGGRLALLAGLGLVASLSASRAGAQQTCQLPDGTQSPTSCYSQNPADWPAPARPYFMVVFDVSGSMNQCTTPATTFPTSCPAMDPVTSPNNTCGLRPTRINDGKCALRKMVQSFSEVDFGLTTFSQTITGCSATCTPYAVDGFMPETAGTCSVTTACPDPTVYTGTTAKGGTVRVPLPVSTSTLGNMLRWVDDDCTAGEELLPAGATPINGALRDAGRHLRTNAASLTPTCRPVNVILITDGGESCDGTEVENRAKYAAQDLYLNGLQDTSGRNVKVYPIGFGGVTTAEQTALDAIAKMGQCGAETGACATATKALVANNEAELSQKLAAIIAGAVQPEECDNKDNNCNGCVDEGYRHYCNQNQTCCNWANSTQRDACIASYKATLPNGDPTKLPCATPTQGNNCAQWLCYNPGDKCDNIDNNCYAGVDENQLKCNGQCPSQEVCDGVDNDCNGQIDELPTCTVCVPSAEICDGCDNDCDGIADDNVDPLVCGLPSPANCVGQRACKTAQPVPKPGQCVSGGPGDFWGTCVTSPSNEVCNGIDDNCNGTIDDNIAPTPCEIPGQSGLVYQDTFPASQCKKGSQPCNGICSGYVGPTVEVCDGIDNDCDGVVDDSPAGVGIACGTSSGVCSKGLSACVNGVLVCQGGQQPQPEICDGLDNDCNGFVDDGALQDAPPADQKPCWNLPAQGCDPICSYLTQSWCPPAGATCHDVGTLSAPCALGSLSCKAGSWQCLGGQVPQPEVCDGVDNDCVNGVDNGIAETACGTDEGECTSGTQKCVNGGIVCEGSVGPTQEKCNALDDDCDGVVDNGISIGTPCFPTFDTTQYPVPPNRESGECKPGVTECDSNGQQVCTGGVGPSPEVCDGKDNDCDGQVDESGTAPDGVNGTSDPNDPSKVIGQPCGENKGECKQGVWACAAGVFVCQGGAAAQPEICDCKDNDCDGLIDEDPVSGSGDPELCSTGKTCVEYSNTCQCAAPCQGGEFPCPTGGYTCQLVDKSGTEPPESAGKRCVTDPCLGGCEGRKVESNGKIECAPAGTVVDGGTAPPVCQCKGASGCHNPCYGVTCTNNQVCSDYGSNPGTCVVDNCYNVPCPSGKACNNGTCVTNPCKADSCKAGEVCKPSDDFTKPVCFGSCAGITCKATEQCVAGKCEATGCSQQCPDGQVCSGGDAGTCIKSKCDPNPCTDGKWCNPATGQCGNDPCSGVLCPANQSCSNGQCTASVVDAGPDAKAEGGKGGSGGSAGAAGNAGNAGNAGSAQPGEDKGKYGLATGGGGCACKVGSTSSAPKSAGFAALVAVALLAARRRKRQCDTIPRNGKSDACSTLSGRGGAR